VYANTAKPVAANASGRSSPQTQAAVVLVPSTQATTGHN